MSEGIRRHASGLALALVALVAVSGCGARASTDAAPIGAAPTGAAPTDAAPTASISLPPTDGAMDYQLGGAYPTADGVTVVVRDSTAAPEPGAYSVCYVNGFQSQPEDDWPAALLLHDERGAPIVDPDWPDEHVLDISTPEKRSRILARLEPAIERCADAGFDAVEFDNLDSHSRSGGRLTLEHALAHAAPLVHAAHERGLAAAQKNTAELGDRGRIEAGFDFAVTEECDRFDECDAFSDVFGARVLNIEYFDALRGSVDEVCARPRTPRLTVFRDRDLEPAGSRGHRFEVCRAENRE